MFLLKRLKKLLFGFCLLSSALLPLPSIAHIEEKVGRLVPFPELNAYVSYVGKKVAAVSEYPHLPYEFVVLNSPVPNAWAFPDGKIAVTRALLVELNSEAELAAVLAHELGHQTSFHREELRRQSASYKTDKEDLITQPVLGHQWWKFANTMVDLIQLKMMREEELFADREGIRYLVSAGYDVEAANRVEKLFERLSGEQQAQTTWFDTIFRTHPLFSERIKANLATMSTYPLQPGFIGQELYQRVIHPLRENYIAYRQAEAANENLKERNFSAAQALAQQAMQRLPNEPSFYALWARIQLRLGQIDAAHQAIDQAITLDSSFFGFPYLKGVAYQRQGLVEKAREQFEKSLDLFPSPQAFYRLGKMDLKEQLKDQAVERLKMASQQSSQIGKKAHLLLSRLQLHAHPESFLNIRTDIQDGTLMIKAQNKSRYSIHIIGMRVSVSSSEQPMLAKVIEIPLTDRLEPKQNLYKLTQLSEVCLDQRCSVQVQLIADL